MVEFAPIEFDRDKVDKIIIESNAKMDEIIKWMEDNIEWLQTEQMKSIHPAFTSGYIEFQGEDIGLGFNCSSDIRRFYVYMENHYMFKFDFNEERDDLRNIQPIFPPGLPKERRKKLSTVLKMDKTIWKLIMKHDALMVYATLHKETIVSNEPKRKSTGTSAPKANGNNILPLTPKRYVISYIDKSVSGHHMAPDYQVEVRPTVRHLKNGKVVPVKGFTKYKDKPKKDNGPRTYKA